MATYTYEWSITEVSDDGTVYAREFYPIEDADRAVKDFYGWTRALDPNLVLFALTQREFDEDEEPNPLLGPIATYENDAIFVPRSGVAPPKAFEDENPIPAKYYKLMRELSKGA